MRRVAAALILMAGAGACAAQGNLDNTIHVKAYPGVTVGQKVFNAMAGCNANTAIPCILIIDPSLAAFPTGTMPTLCSQCSLWDARTGAPAAGNTVDLTNFVNFIGLPATGSSDSVTNRFTNWVAESQTGAVRPRSFLWVDPQVPADALDGSGNPMPNQFAFGGPDRILDARGTNCMDASGGFTFGDNGWCFEAIDTATDYNGAVSADYTFSNSYKSGAHVGYNSLGGGTYLYNGQLPNGYGKSNRFGLNVTAEFHSAAQNWLENIGGNFLSGGESMGYGGVMNVYGGMLGNGQLADTFLWGQVQQPGATDSLGGFFFATNAQVSSNTVNYTPSSLTNSATLGETRIVRDLDSAYRTGTYTAVSCSGANPKVCTITGSGTTWTSIPGFVSTHTTWNGVSTGGPMLTNNLTFCPDGGSSNAVDNAATSGAGTDLCVPVYQGISDTSLSVVLYFAGTLPNSSWPSNWPTSGTYAIYRSALPTTVVPGLNQFLTGDASGITNGHRIDQVAAYNQVQAGLAITLNRQVGATLSGVGLVVQNNSPNNNSAYMGAAVETDGPFEYQTCEGCGGTPSNLPPIYDHVWKHASSARFWDQQATIASHENGFFYNNSAGTQIELWGYNGATGTYSDGMTFMGSKANINEAGEMVAVGFAQAPTNNWIGLITISSANNGSATFTVPFVHSPICTATPFGTNPGSTSWWVNANSSTITVELSTTTSLTFSYICMAQQN